MTYRNLPGWRQRGGPQRVGMRLAMLLMLAGCAARDSAQYAPADPRATPVPIFIATERELDRTGAIFGEARPTGMRYFRNVISIPPTHTPGQIEWPDGPANAATGFAVTQTEIYSGAPGMVSAIRAAQAGPETLVFVHGYNNTLSEAMYRTAQIRTDFQFKMPTVLFSWASAGDPRGYIYDRDSVLYARDDLHRVLRALTEHPKEKVLLMAHSMGGQLVMEVLRQAAISGDRKFLSRISGVVLMSPDIDPELFRRQAEAIGKLPQPFIIFASREDRALGLAGLLTGRKPRLGVIDSPDKIEGLGVTLVDFTALGRRNGLNHDVPVSSPAARRIITGMMQQTKSQHSAFDRYMVLGGTQPCNGNVPKALRLPISGPAFPGAC